MMSLTTVLSYLFYCLSHNKLPKTATFGPLTLQDLNRQLDQLIVYALPSVSRWWAVAYLVYINPHFYSLILIQAPNIKHSKQHSLNLVNFRTSSYLHA